jgi:tRNA 2-thiouridine synthesizing protein A
MSIASGLPLLVTGIFSCLFENPPTRPQAWDGRKAGVAPAPSRPAPHIGGERTLDKVDLELDLKGLKCPLPVLKTRKAIAGLTAGARVRVLSTDPMSVIDIPHFCQEAGHKLISRETDGDEVHVFLLERA